MCQVNTQPGHTCFLNLVGKALNQFRPAEILDIIADKYVLISDNQVVLCFF